MKIKKQICLLLALLVWILTLCGCTVKKEKRPESNASVVTQVRVYAPGKAAEPYRIYTADEKIRSILDYVDGLSAESVAEKAPDEKEQAWQILCQYANGRTKNYHLYNGLYFQEDTQPWMLLTENAQGGFALLLKQFTSDSDPDDAPQSTESFPGQYKIP